MSAGPIGGASGDAGVEYRRAIAAYAVAHALAREPLPGFGFALGLARVVEVAVETDEHADDVRVTLVGGHRAQVQAKRSVRSDAVLGVAVAQWAAAAKAELDPLRDRLVLATRIASGPVQLLARALERCKTDQPGAFTGGERNALERLDGMLVGLTARQRESVRRCAVISLLDVEEEQSSGAAQARLLLGRVVGGGDAAVRAWRDLVAHCGRVGRLRGGLGVEGWARLLREDGHDLSRFPSWQARQASAQAPSAGLQPVGLAPGATDSGLPVVRSVGDWSRLGIHPPITILSDGSDLGDELAAGRLPAYVHRLADSGLRTAMREMAAPEPPAAVRMIVVVGDSAAGKTRSAVEGMRAEVPDWRLLIPAGADSLGRLLDSGLSLQRTVIWLDEIQDVLDQPAGREHLARLLAAPDGPTLLLATVRSEVEHGLRSGPARRFLDGAVRIELRRRLGTSEMADAERLGADPWIGEALSRIGDDWGLAEYLAAGPQLVRRWLSARGHAQASTSSAATLDAVGAAIVDAAIDCYRGGYTIPIPETMLRELYPAYLDPVLRPGHAQEPEAFASALAWARERVCGASSLLLQPDGQGYQAFDYLLGHAGASDRPPAQQLWTTLLNQATPATLLLTARAANEWGRRDVTDECLRRADAAELPTAELRDALDDEEGLRRLADNDDYDAQETLAWRLLSQGADAALQDRAAAGDWMARELVADRLAEQGQRAQLAAQAALGDETSAESLAILLRKDQEEKELKARSAAGDRHASTQLAILWIDRGEEHKLVRAANRNPSDTGLAKILAGVLLEREDEQELRAQAFGYGRYNPAFAECLAVLLGRRDDLDGLSALADDGDRLAQRELAHLLRRRRDRIALERRASNNFDPYASKELVELLLEQRDWGTLRHRADGGCDFAARALATHNANQGAESELRLRADAGDSNARTALTRLMAVRTSPE